MQNAVHCLAALLRDLRYRRQISVMRTAPCRCRRLRRLLLPLDICQNLLGAEVGRQNNDGIFKIHRSALGIRDAAIVQNLQQNVEHIRMGLFHLIKQNNRIRFSADRLRQLAALLIADIPGCRTDQPGNTVLLHVLRHVDPYHVLLIIEQGSGQCLGKLCFADAGRPQEQEGPDGLCRILDARLRAHDGLCHLCDSLILSNHASVKLLRKVQRFAALRLGQLFHRDARPFGNDAADFILGNLFMHQAAALLGLGRCLLALLDSGFNFRKLSILELCRMLEIPVSRCHFNLGVHCIALLAKLRQ